MNRNVHRIAHQIAARKGDRQSIEGLEARQLMAATIKGTDVAIIAASDGTKDNGNNVIIKYNVPIASADLTKMRMFGYSNNTINGGQVKTTINIKSATVSGNNVTLLTDVQIRKGATITINAGGVTAQDNSAPAASVRTTKGLNRDRFTLALRAFRPINKTYFSSQILTGGSAPQTANTAPTTSVVRQGLSDFLAKKVKEKTITQAQMDASLVRYDDPAVVAKVPAPNLRAGILSLIGTIGAPAIGFYLDKANTTGKDFSEIDFDGASFSSAASINETRYTNTGKLKQVWNPNYAGESFVVLSGLLAHETAHEGRESTSNGELQQVGQSEEIVANTIENVVYAQQVVTDYTYAQRHSVLTLRANYREMLLLNSGDRQFPRVGILVAPNVRRASANPGFGATEYDNRTTAAGKPVEASFEADVRQEYKFRNFDNKETATYPTVRTILTNLTGNNYSDTTLFNQTLLSDIDISQDTISDPFAMRVARVLQVSV